MPRSEPARRYDHLRVDDYLTSHLDARALAAALKLGLIDRLVEQGPTDRQQLAEATKTTAVGFDLLVGMLAANGVLAEDSNDLSLTPAFRAALAYRDLFEAKTDFADAVLPDVHQLFTQLLCAPQEFMARSRVFDLFRYDRATGPGPGHEEATRRWMRFTTILTRYEAGPGLDHFDMAGHRRILDVGGNSGEFALAICRRHPAAEVTVFDLPLVCNVGREHVSTHAEAARITFQPGDARRDAYPEADLVTFKSFLHDWGEAESARFLAKAHDALPPGGRVMIYERGPIGETAGTLAYHQIPALMFLHFLRPPEVYLDQLVAAGFVDGAIIRIELEMPFHIVSATRPG